MHRTIVRKELRINSGGPQSDTGGRSVLNVRHPHTSKLYSIGGSHYSGALLTRARVQTEQARLTDIRLQRTSQTAEAGQARVQNNAGSYNARQKLRLPSGHGFKMPGVGERSEQGAEPPCYCLMMGCHGFFWKLTLLCHYVSGDSPRGTKSLIVGGKSPHVLTGSREKKSP
uniref:Uncharacterized protein n=1 Tax=Erpetoichthys calabaricus TaxID=27687 RepID=A0A8C4RXF6_ERPCA